MASQYYSSLGIGGIARPMVVGDRLWLFSQPPHGPPAPLQSLLLNNVPPAPQHMNIHPSVLARSYPSPSPATTMMSRTNQGYNLNPSRSPPGFMGKQMRFDYFNKVPFSPYERPVDFRFGSKPILKSGTSVDHHSSELESLESRFGNNSSILSDNNSFTEAINVNEDERSSSCSEIDCEEIEL